LHLLPFFADQRPSEITATGVKQYMAAKQAEREERDAEIAAWRRKDPKKRGRMPARGLSNATINKTLKVLAQVLDEAVEDGLVAENVARGKRRRLRAAKPRRTWLELGQVQALLEAAGEHRSLLAAMILTGLRVGELCSLRWRDLDLAGARLRVTDSKTAAGVRVVDVTPDLLDELKLHRAEARYSAPEDLVFPTSRGTRRNRSNITRQIVQPAVERANVELAKVGSALIEGLTNHSMRRTFCALLYEAGASPAYVMAQMGHTDASLALEVYAKVMERQRDTGERMDALLRGTPDRVVTGSEASSEVVPVAVAANEKPLFPAAS
jgi:integrase